MNYFNNRSLFYILRQYLKLFSKELRKILYGMTLHELDLEIKKQKGQLDHLFMLIVFGDLIGLPILPPYYSMRILPYIYPSIERWKRSLLREKDLTDILSQDIG
ncbi:MAG: hypothetical protein ACUVQ9_08700 [Thermodesulfobacteriota bacterium]